MNYKPVAIQITVATAGTPERVSSDSALNTRTVAVQADPDNSAGEYILVGGAEVDDTHAIKLAPGQSIAFEVAEDYINLSALYLDATANGLKANIIYAARF